MRRMRISVLTEGRKLHLLNKRKSEALGFTFFTLFVFGALLFFVWDVIAWIILITSFTFAVLDALVTRTSRCVFDLTDQSIVFEEAGILNSRFDQSKHKYNLSDLDAIHVSRDQVEGMESYIYSIRLVIRNAQHSPAISWDDLSAEECQHILPHLEEFVHPDTPIVRVN